MTENTIGGFLNRLLDHLERGIKAEDEKKRRDAITENDYKEDLYLCSGDGCTFIDEDEEKIRNHIEEKHDVGGYEKIEAEKTEESDTEPFRITEASVESLQKQDRKDMVKDWFNDQCEFPSTIPEIGREVFGTGEISSGDTEYTMIFSILDELRDDGFLETVKDGGWNRYYSNESQLEEFLEGADSGVKRVP